MQLKRMLTTAAAAALLPMAAQAQNTPLLMNSFLAPQHPVTRV
jgi:hypothetical protein